ncbi:MAG: cobalt-precorrin-5B (C(1))-methyltransferase CbiD, partial [Clostridiales bacterium]
MEDYLLFNGKRLRLGYTTGSCAAAAAKGALLYLLQGYPPQEVVIDTPAGKRLTLIIAESRRDEQGAIAAVQKDGGDDPDATHGMLIFAHLDLRDDGRIIIDGGLGVGRVTKDGLACAIGQAAINPVPRRMIEQELRSILPAGMGADVIISVPGGEEIAKRTFNPRLGIMGGISILGTS